MDSAFASYTGLGGILGCDFTLCRGVTPSVAQLFMLPQANLALGPGTLTFTQGSESFSFANCATSTAFLREREFFNRYFWSVSVLDRRWRWAFGAIDGQYNRRRPDGTVDPATEKNPQELMQLIFDVLGETADLSRVPTATVRPYVHWQGISPDLALADLCERVACEVVLTTGDTIEVWPLGSGGDTPTGAFDMHPKFRFVPRSVPSVIEVVGGPTVYQSKLVLEAVGRQADGEQTLLDDLDYAPTDWEDEFPWSLPSVTGDDRPPALDTVFREYRIKEQDGGGLEVENCPAVITSVMQYLTLPHLLDHETDLDDFAHPLPPFVEGTYWPYSSLPKNVTDQRYTGRMRLDTRRNVVMFPHPLYKLSTSGGFNEAELKLTAAYHVRDEDGRSVRTTKSVALGGTGGRMTLRRPEIFASYDNENSTDTQAEADAEADAYLDLFKAQFGSAAAHEISYAGLRNVSPNGVIAQVRWRCRKNRPALTMAAAHEELDVMTPSRKERRRREVLRHLVEVLG